MKHYSGFINIIGQPNVGKSTLMNELVGEKMSIISYKPQTTRHRILGLISGDDFQMVFSDSPGIIDMPSYKMQKAMNSFAFSSFEDADILLFVTDVTEDYEKDHPIFNKLEKLNVPKFLIINKIDLIPENELREVEKKWAKLYQFNQVFSISAKEKIGIDGLFSAIKKSLPEGPVYYPKDQLSDKPERFFVSEIIRESIFLQYKQEIPYSCEVVIQEFKVDETDNIIRIFAEIYVARKSQKGIIIGKSGQAIKQLGISSRKALEKFFERRIHLELYVRIKDNWRDDDKMLKNFGYSHK